MPFQFIRQSPLPFKFRKLRLWNRFDINPLTFQIETEMEHLAVRAQKELILLHPDDARRPRNTVDWLNARGWCSSHHHIRCPKRVFSKRSKTRMVRSLNSTSPNPTYSLTAVHIHSPKCLFSKRSKTRMVRVALIKSPQPRNPTPT